MHVLSLPFPLLLLEAIFPYVPADEVYPQLVGAARCWCPCVEFVPLGLSTRFSHLSPIAVARGLFYVFLSLLSIQFLFITYFKAFLLHY